MMFTRKKFRTAVYWDACRNNYRRVSTGESADAPCLDDIYLDQNDSPAVPAGPSLPDNVIVVSSLKQMRAYFRGPLIATILVAAAFFVGLFYSVFSTVRRYYAGGTEWYNFILMAAMATLTLLYFAQAVNPVVHDSAGHWLNLRTGSTNLNGGCVILKRGVDKPSVQRPGAPGLSEEKSSSEQSV